MSKVEMIFIDNMEYMKSLRDKSIDWGIVDPEYGRGMAAGLQYKNGRSVKQANGKTVACKLTNIPKKDWDKNPAPPEYFKELIRVTKNQFIFGVNYMPYLLQGGRFIWDKCNGDSHQSDAEIAYVSTIDRVDIFKYMWSGFQQGKSMYEGHIQQGNKKLNEIKIHPTQKPVILYDYILTKYLNKGDTILDTHGGSRSLCISAHKLGHDIISLENDEDHHRDSIVRFKEETNQRDLFAA